MVTPAQSSRRFLGQGDKLGTYEVIRQIAVGGTAELYLARTVGMEGFEKLVCVKRILPQYLDQPSFVAMFLDEARIAATLHHPNIAQVYDIGQEPGELFFAMEYVHGEDLGRLVATARDSGVPISLDCALTLASGLCAGLHHAHEKASPDGKALGLVHGDVSPSNVLVSYDGAVKLVDFGIARAGGEPATVPAGERTRVSYMSPEQRRGATLDRRSDVFSIGAILYELTCGRLPFGEDGAPAEAPGREVEPPSKLVPSYPAELESIVMRALARDVHRRFATALELQNQLEEFANDSRLRVSPLVLARLMSTLFPTRLEEWDHARAQGAFFVEQHVVRTLIESGKAPDAAARGTPEALPPAADDFSAALRSVTIEAGAPEALAATHGETAAKLPALAVPPPPAGSVPLAPPVVATGAPGRAATAAGAAVAPAAALPAVAASAAAPAVATHASLPRLATPAPSHGPGPRHASMPVPNMPGAVPIMTPLTAPPIASAGTLVSSALTAGSAPTVMLTSPSAGVPSVSRPSAVVMPSVNRQASAIASTNRLEAPHVPAAAADFGEPSRPGPRAARNGYAGYGPPLGLGDPARREIGEAAPKRASRGSEPAPVRQASTARPTLVVRAARRRWLPIAAVVGAAAIAVVALLVMTSGDEPAAPTEPSPSVASAPGVAASPVPPATASPAVAPVEAAAAPAAAPGSPGAPGTGEPAGTSMPAPVAGAAATAAGHAAPAAAVADPGPAGSPPAQPAGATATGTDGKAAVSIGAAPGAPGREPAGDTAPAPPAASAGSVERAAVHAAPSRLEIGSKRTAKVAAPDPRGKPGRSRIRPGAKRNDNRRGSKTEPKEPSWNDDSPFMPVPTPRR